MSRTYFAFQFASGRRTTTGQPNKNTGRYSVAGWLKAFRSAKARDEWVANGKVTSDMRGNCREAITAKEARELCAGSSMINFQETIEASLWDADNE